MHGYLQMVVDHQGRCANREFAELPALCPFCHQHAQPYRLEARSTDAEGRAVDFAFQCSRPSCRRVFVASYHRGLDGGFELDEPARDARHQHALVMHV